MDDAGLRAWGWDAAFLATAPRDLQTDVAAGHLDIARVIEGQRGAFRIIASKGEDSAKLAGRAWHRLASRADLPAVGDWVAIEHQAGVAPPIIRAVLPRRSKFSRQAAGGRSEEQVVATNIDAVWLVSGIDQPLNVRRLERYLSLALSSGAKPVVVLTKLDLCPDIPAAVTDAERVAGGLPVHAVSNRTGEGLADLESLLVPGHTIALLGMSGAGKSTLVNSLAGTSLVKTGAVREVDGKGRHTTTSRQLIRLPSGVLLIDTPGMRELAMWDADTGIEDAFSDVEQFTSACRFADCSHQREPGCAVRAAIARGELAEERLVSYLNLRQEDKLLHAKQGARPLSNSRPPGRGPHKTKPGTRKQR